MAAGLYLTLLAGAAWADGRVVSLIVPYPAGGGSDIVARQLQPELGRRLGETVIVENLAGASGSIGTQRVVSAAPDGHTLLAGTPMEIMLTPLGMAAARYKPEDLRPVGQFATTTMVMLVRRAWAWPASTSCCSAPASPARPSCRTAASGRARCTTCWASASRSWPA
jgi:tripartite-type tricarboxylate transporter receptor subunit TctC